MLFFIPPTLHTYLCVLAPFQRKLTQDRASAKKKKTKQHDPLPTPVHWSRDHCRATMTKLRQVNMRRSIIFEWRVRFENIVTFQAVFYPFVIVRHLQLIHVVLIINNQCYLKNDLNQHQFELWSCGFVCGTNMLFFSQITAPSPPPHPYLSNFVILVYNLAVD